MIRLKSYFYRMSQEQIKQRFIDKLAQVYRKQKKESKASEVNLAQYEEEQRGSKQLASIVSESREYVEKKKRHEQYRRWMQQPHFRKAALLDTLLKNERFLSKVVAELKKNGDLRTLVHKRLSDGMKGKRQEQADRSSLLIRQFESSVKEKIKSKCQVMLARCKLTLIHLQKQFDDNLRLQIQKTKDRLNDNELYK